MYKQVMVVRNDLKMSKGKLAVQCCHASYSSAKNASSAAKLIWEQEAQKKVVLKVESLGELLAIKKACDHAHIKNYLVTDAGLTELEPGTITVLGIGPDREAVIDKITGHLKLLG
ncbi:MAG: peptidyl-tRNA hydrolase [Candidatus Aenigmarchaeota archaeon]|nr:peptidyl-tRNA hydrolase [Candidatus Aenigmarchaeota archaeon]